MPRHLHLAAVLLALVATTPAPAQFHFPQHTTKAKVPREDLSWLAPFAQPEPDGRENDLIHEPRFKSFLRDHLSAPQTFWNDNQSLADTVMDFLGVPGKVLLDDNRYLSIDGCVPHFCPSRGLLFVDLGVDHPLVAFAAIDWTRDNKTPSQSGAEYTLWLFSNRVLRTTTTDAETTAIPAPLIHTIARWSAQPSSGSTTLQNITSVILVDPDGTPHAVPPSTLGITAVSPQPATSNQQPQAPPK